MLFKEQIASYEKTEDTEVAKLKGKKKEWPSWCYYKLVDIKFTGNH